MPGVALLAFDLDELLHEAAQAVDDLVGFHVCGGVFVLRHEEAVEQLRVRAPGQLGRDPRFARREDVGEHVPPAR